LLLNIVPMQQLKSWELQSWNYFPMNFNVSLSSEITPRKPFANLTDNSDRFYQICCELCDCRSTANKMLWQHDILCFPKP